MISRRIYAWQPLLPTLLVLFIACSLAQAAESDSGNWPCWRGPQHNAVCLETGLLKAWPEEGPRLAWKIDTIGEGYSTASVVDGVIYTMGNRDGNEQVIALDATQQGKEHWATTIGPVRHDGAGYPGPRSTPAFDEGRLYTLGLNGDLVCLDAHSGRIIWRRDLVADFGGAIPNWGYSESVLVDGPWVLFTPGGSKATLAAVDKATGETVWQSPIGDGAGYSSIIISKAVGPKQYVQFTAQGLLGVRARDGQFLWRYNAPANGTANISTPVASGPLVFAASGYGAGGGLVELESNDETVTAKQIYFTKSMKNHHGGMVLVGDYLYGSNDPGLLTCLEFKTGKVKWADRAPGKCAVLYADGRIYSRSEDGKVCLVEAQPDGFQLHGTFEQPDRSAQPSWPHPIIANGVLYLRDQGVLLAYDVRGK